MLGLKTLRRVVAVSLPAATLGAAISSLALAQSPAPVASSQAAQRPRLLQPMLRVPRKVELPEQALPTSREQSAATTLQQIGSQPIQLVQAVEPAAPSQQQAAPAAGANATNPLSPEALQALPGEHPLMPAIRLAKYGMNNIDTNIKDYSCTLVKRERVGEELLDYEYIFTKVRHQPFSVYMFFLGPATIKGREVVWVNGANNNKMTAHEGGKRGKILPTVHIDPNSLIAMRGQRYPISEVGVRTLTARLIEVAERDSQFGECDVKFFKGAKINGREATCIEVVHPVQRQNFLYHLARVFIDEELKIPVRFESYGWPTQAGEAPPLFEEYTYMNLKLNNGFTDEDFNERNKNYNFHR